MNFLNSTDSIIDAYYGASWKSSLPFPGCVLCHKNISYAEEVKSFKPSTIDLFEHCGNGLYRDWVTRFDPGVYHVPKDLSTAFERTSDGWKLIQMIQLMLADSGQGNFVSNGGKSEWKGQRREIICARYKVFKKKKTEDEGPTNTVPFREISSRNNQRVAKKITRKCTTTSLQVDPAEKCTCRLLIGVDNDSYYIISSLGNALHCNHLKVDPNETVTKKRHVSLECLETIK